VTVHPAAAVGFARSADAYERGRPDYPPAAVEWLSGRLGLGPGRVAVDLAAGTGKLTRALVTTGADVIAVEPVAEMRAGIDPRARALDGTAEQIPLADASADAVTVAQAFHWFKAEEALNEIRRVLKPGGRLGLVWNRRDESVPWVAELGRLLDRYERDTPRFARRLWAKAFEANAPFTPLEERTFQHEHELDVQGLQDRVVSVSFIAALDDDERGRVLGEVAAIAGGLPARFSMPYVTEVFCCSRR
jgi:SAM-dependent methyltransferase